MWPDFQSPLILLDEDYRHLDGAVNLLDTLGGWDDLRQRLLEIRRAAAERGDVQLLRAAFFRWFTEYDRRRRTRFAAVFPELAPFWADCARAASAAHG
jgi:hypothetical protein